MTSTRERSLLMRNHSWEGTCPSDSPHPCLAACLTAGALAVTGLALGAQPPAQAADTTPGYSVTPITVRVKTGPDNDQPCTVSADIYKPDDVSATHKAPAILTTNGFGGSKDDSNEAAIGKGFVNQGYVVLAYSGLGFGTTTCKISLDDPQYDGKAGRGWSTSSPAPAATRSTTAPAPPAGSATSPRSPPATRGSA